METSLHTLLSEIIDYAGLFPPASLSMDESIRNYAKYRPQKEAWMLSHFICPASRLHELKPYREELFTNGNPFKFSVIGRGGEDTKTFISNLQVDLQDIASFQEYHGDQIIVDMFEVRFPVDVSNTNDKEQVAAVLEQAANIIEAEGPPSLTLFYEAIPGNNWKDSFSTVIAGIAAHNQKITGEKQYQRYRAPDYRAPGFKLRSGGVEASQFPTPEQVAFVISKCRESSVALKCTAGLHHPVRHFNDSVQTKMHGFFNVFGAGVLAHTHHLSEKEIAVILNEENVNNFQFDSNTFACNGTSVTSEQIRQARQEFMISFGSCSFDEPREDLQALGLL